MPDKTNDAPEHLQHELEAARAQIETQQQQIALLAQDRRMFLDNLSQQLLTPLESILILSRLLEANATGNLTEQQVEYATVIGRSSTELQHLIRELLALAQATDQP